MSGPAAALASVPTASAPALGPAPARRRLSLTAAVGALVAVGGLALGLRPLGDNSFLTHLATGRWVLEHGRVPLADVYSFTAPGHPWVVQSWLPSVAYAALERVGGGHAVVVATGLLTAALAALLWRLTRPADSLVARLLLAVLVLVAGTWAWSERPLMVGLLLLGVTLLAAEGRLDPRWLLPALGVWANSHGSFPLALVVLGLLAAGRRLDGGSPATELRALRWAAAGTALAVLNPVGLRLLTFPGHMLARRHLLRGVVEWQSPDFTSAGPLAFLAAVVLAVAALTRRPSWRAALPVLVLVPAALVAARNAPIALLALLPGTAAGLAGLGSIDGDRRRPAGSLLGAAAAVAGVVLLVAALIRPAFDLGGYPQAAVAWMGREGLLDRHARVVSVDVTGNYLELVAGGDVPVFFDDRYDMYPAPVVEDHYALVRADARWRQILERHQATAVLWPRSRPLAQVLAEAAGWRVAYADADWLVALPE